MAEVPETIKFGPFFFEAEHNRLWRYDVALRIGRRPLELLAHLIRRAGAVVSHRELIDAVWPGMGVDAASLRVHMSVLRRALNASGTEYIVNEHGRGYRLALEAPPEQGERSISRALPNLPAEVGTIVGREDVLASILASMESRRLISIVGPGGIGKTTIALAAAWRRPAELSEAAFVDLATLADESSITEFVALALGFDPRDHRLPFSLGHALADRKILMVLDNCEHVAEAAAEVAEAILLQARNVVILATSREPLRAQGEKIHRLPGLKFPHEAAPTTLDAARHYSAIDLFIQRAQANVSDVVLDDTHVAMIADICCRLDGIPLAIELVAGWFGALGIADIYQTLSSGLLTVGEGRRTAKPRHRTLNAALDWSYRALSNLERTMLQRLSVFAGAFSLDVAAQVVVGEPILDTDVSRLIASLAAKSLVAIDRTGDLSNYRLLETTRAYASALLYEDEDYNLVKHRHALTVMALLRRGPTLPAGGVAQQPLANSSTIADLRQALSWAFSSPGNAAVALELTELSLRLGLQYRFLKEFRTYVRSALKWVTEGDRKLGASSGKLVFALNEMDWQITGDVNRFTIPVRVDNQTQAEANDSAELVMSEWGRSFTTGDYPTALSLSHRMYALAHRTGDELTRWLATRLEAQALHYLGQHRRAKLLAQSVIDAPIDQLPFSPVPHKLSMIIILARIAYLEGDVSHSDELLRRAMAENASQNPFNTCQLLGLVAAPIALWGGKMDAASALLGAMCALAEQNGLVFWSRWAEAMSSALAPLTGKTELSRSSTTRLSNPKINDLLATVDQRLITPLAIERSAAGLVGWTTPELIRAKAGAFTNAGPSKRRVLLERAIALATTQGAVAWRKRAEADLERLGCEAVLDCPAK